MHEVSFLYEAFKLYLNNFVKQDDNGSLSSSILLHQKLAVMVVYTYVW